MSPKDPVDDHKHEFEGSDSEHCSECGKELDENEKLEAEAQSRDIAINALKGSQSFILLTFDNDGNYGSTYRVKDLYMAASHLGILKTKIEMNIIHGEYHAEQERDEGED